MSQQLQLTAVLRELASEGKVFVTLHSWKLCLEHTERLGLRITTSVYRGENYIPGSVRQAVHDDPFQGLPHLKTYLTIDEAFFAVSLHYRGTAEDISQNKLPRLLEEFSWAAEQWWAYLDDQDKRDLIHLRVR